MERFLVILGIFIVASVIYTAIKEMKKKKTNPKGGSGGGEGQNNPQDPNYPAQG